MLTMFAVTVFTRSQFNFLGDPATPVVVLSMCLVCEGTRRGMTYASMARIGYFEWRGLWATKQLEGTMDDAVAARLAVGVGNQAGLEQERLELQALNSDRFRTRFMERNRPWVLQHLVDLIPAEVIKSMPPDSIEQIRGIYADLNNLGKGMRRPGDRPDISSDTDDDETERERRRQWDRAPLPVQQVQVARSWVQRAKKRLALSRVVQGTIENSRASSCSFCGRKSHQCKSLAASLAKDGDRDPYALDELIRSFEVEYGEDEENLDLWKAFFRTNASFVTTCDMCMSSATATRAIPREEVRVASAVDISSDEDSDGDNDRVPFDAVVSVDQRSRDAITIWLNAARSRLGTEEPSSAANKVYVMAIEPSQQQMMAHWLHESRRSKAKREAERGAEIRRTVAETAARMKPENDWFISSSLREEGQALVERGKQLDSQRASLKHTMGAEVEAIRANLTSIKCEAEEELNKGQKNRTKELEDAEKEHGQRVREVQRIGSSEEEVGKDTANERGRLERVLSDRKDEIRHRHQRQQESILARVAVAETNAATAIRDSEQQAANTLAGPEHEFRAAALLWIERGQRRLRALEEEEIDE